MSSDKELARIVKTAFETVFAISLSKVSLLFALFYIKSGRDVETLIGVKNGA